MHGSNSCNLGNDDNHAGIPLSIVSVGVSLSIPLLITVVLCYPIFKLLGLNDFTHMIAQLIAGVSFSVLPIYYFNRILKIKKEAFGLKKAGLSLSRIFEIGAVWAVCYFIVTMSIYISIGALYWKPVRFDVLIFFILPFTFNGFVWIFATPITEEILFRGVILSYLIEKGGFSIGLILQALIFGYMHFLFKPYFGIVYFVNCSLIGGFLGILYKKTGSLYPSMVCHGVLNYLLFFSDKFFLWPINS